MAAPIEVGSYDVSIAATGDYTSTTPNPVGTFTITPKPVTFSFGNTSNGYTGGTFTASVAPSDSAATFTRSTSYGPNVGAYAVSATATGNYTGTGQASASVTPAAVSFSFGATDQTYTGDVLAATVSANPAGATYNASLTGGPDVGTYGISASGIGNYAGSASGTLAIAKATPSLSWPTPAAITYGTALSATQLNATASVPGSFSYSPAAGTMPAVGTTTLNVAFSPSDARNYDSVSRSVALTVRPKPVTFTFGGLSATYDGTMKAATVAASDPAATFTADLSKGPDAGSYTVSARATGNFTGSNAATLVISPAPQVVTLTPAALTLVAGQTATFTAAGGHNPYQWGGNAGATAAGNSASATFTAPGTYTVTVTNAASANYLPSNTATATIVVGASAQIVSFTPLESSYTVSDPASPMNGQTYPRMWKSGGWVAYLGRPGVQFAVQAQASPAVKTVELQTRPPGGAWTKLASHTPGTTQVSIDQTFSVELGESAPGQPLVPLSYSTGTPQTGTWAFRARVQDSEGNWSAFSPEVPVDVILPITAKAVSGRTVPPAGPLGDWFTASAVQTYTLQFWVP